MESPPPPSKSPALPEGSNSNSQFIQCNTSSPTPMSSSMSQDVPKAKSIPSHCEDGIISRKMSMKVNGDYYKMSTFDIILQNCLRLVPRNRIKPSNPKTSKLMVEGTTDESESSSAESEEELSETSSDDEEQLEWLGSSDSSVIVEDSDVFNESEDFDFVPIASESKKLTRRMQTRSSNKKAKHTETIKKKRSERQKKAEGIMTRSSKRNTFRILSSSSDEEETSVDRPPRRLRSRSLRGDEVRQNSDTEDAMQEELIPADHLQLVKRNQARYSRRYRQRHNIDIADVDYVVGERECKQRKPGQKKRKQTAVELKTPAKVKTATTVLSSPLPILTQQCNTVSNQSELCSSEDDDTHPYRKLPKLSPQRNVEEEEGQEEDGIVPQENYFNIEVGDEVIYSSSKPGTMEEVPNERPAVEPQKEERSELIIIDTRTRAEVITETMDFLPEIEISPVLPVANAEIPPTEPEQTAQPNPNEASLPSPDASALITGTIVTTQAQSATVQSETQPSSANCLVELVHQNPLDVDRGNSENTSASVEIIGQVDAKVCPICFQTIKCAHLELHGKQWHARNDLGPYFFFICGLCIPQEPFQTFVTLVDHVEVRHGQVVAEAMNSRMANCPMPGPGQVAGSGTGTRVHIGSTGLPTFNIPAFRDHIASLVTSTENILAEQAIQNKKQRASRQGRKKSNAESSLPEISSVIASIRPEGPPVVKALSCQVVLACICQKQVALSLEYLQFPKHLVTTEMTLVIKNEVGLVLERIFGCQQGNSGGLPNIDVSLRLPQLQHEITQVVAKVVAAQRLRWGQSEPIVIQNHQGINQFLTQNTPQTLQVPLQPQPRRPVQRRARPQAGPRPQTAPRPQAAPRPPPPRYFRAPLPPPVSVPRPQLPHRTFRCPYCGYVTSQFNYLECHCQVHLVNVFHTASSQFHKMFPCLNPTCEFKFGTIIQVFDHLTSAPQSCSSSNMVRTISTRDNLNPVATPQSFQGQYQVVPCPTNLTQMQGPMNLHQIQEIYNPPPPAPPTPPPPPPQPPVQMDTNPTPEQDPDFDCFYCDSCKTEFQTAEEAERHLIDYHQVQELHYFV